jgi:arylsulfatase A-like enzyme
MASRLSGVIWMAVAGCLLSVHSSAAESRKPNVVVIVGDDMGYADVGVHCCQDIPTHHIDALAAAGMRCTNGYVSGPYCSPTRAGLLTGRYQTRFGHEINPGEKVHGEKPFGLPATETTMADRMKAAGYATGMVGKWHLGNDFELRPPQRGFEEFFGFLGGARTYMPGKGEPIYRGNEEVEETEYLTDAFGREAVAFIDRHKGEPFFLYLAFNAVHTPMEATDGRLEKFKNIANKKRRTYAAMMSAMDDAIGQTLSKLRDEGLEENTLVFFISDNGGPTMEGTTTNASSNAPFRGSKRTTLEGGVRVPFFVKWPAKLPAGKVYEHPVIQLDFLPTALAAAGVDTAKLDAPFDGVDLLPYFTGESEAKPHDALYWRFMDQMAIRKGDWKLVKYDPVVDGGSGLAEKTMLYNLADDAGEERDLFKQAPKKAQELQADWDEWNESNVPPRWTSKKWDAGEKSRKGADGNNKRNGKRKAKAPA